MVDTKPEASAPASANDRAAAAAAAAPSEPAAATASNAEQPSNSNGEDSAESGCPICQFIEAGPCGEQHKVWVACRQEAKDQGVDFVQHCADQFRTFFGCMLKNPDYYQPFLEAFHVDVDKSQEAIDKANEQESEHQQADNSQQTQHSSAPGSGSSGAAS